jgi:hypothetical protein
MEVASLVATDRDSAENGYSTAFGASFNRMACAWLKSQPAAQF